MGLKAINQILFQIAENEPRMEPGDRLKRMRLKNQKFYATNRTSENVAYASNLRVEKRKLEAYATPLPKRLSRPVTCSISSFTNFSAQPD